MPNYALDFMQGYKFVNDINRQKEYDALALEDRNLRNARERKLNDREDAQMAVAGVRNKAMLDGLGPQQPQQAPPQVLQQPQAANVVEGFQQTLSERYGIQPGTPESAQATFKVQHLLANPQEGAEALAIGQNIQQALNAGKNPDPNDMVRYANIMGKTELNNRGGDDGLTREVRRFVPAPSGQGLMAELKITDKDGKIYNAPATTGGSADHKDNVVQEFPIKNIVSWFGGSYETLSAVLEAESKAGVTTTADAYRAYKEKQQGRGEKLQDAVAMYKTETGLKPYAYNGNKVISKNEFDALKPEQQGAFTQLDVKAIQMQDKKFNLDERKTNAEISSHEALTKQREAMAASGGLGGGKGKWIQGADGEWSYVHTNEKVQGKEKVLSKINEDGSVTLADEAGAVVHVLSDKQLREQAQAQAQKESDDIGSQWTSLQPSKKTTTDNAEKIYKKLRDEQQQAIQGLNGGGQEQQPGALQPASGSNGPSMSPDDLMNKIKGQGKPTPTSDQVVIPGKPAKGAAVENDVAEPRPIVDAQKPVVAAIASKGLTDNKQEQGATSAKSPETSAAEKRLKDLDQMDKKTNLATDKTKEQEQMREALKENLIDPAKKAAMEGLTKMEKGRAIKALEDAYRLKRLSGAEFIKRYSELTAS